MITVPVLTKNNEIIKLLNETQQKLGELYYFEFFEDVNNFDSFLRQNFCSLIVIERENEESDFYQYFEKIDPDYFYRFTSTLMVVPNEDARMELDMTSHNTLLLVSSMHDFEMNCTRIFKILNQNVQFLHSRFIQNDMGVREIGQFVCDNDSFDITVYINLLLTYLSNSGRIDFEGKFLLQTALMEMLLNALEHGNCKISYEEKTRWLESGSDMLELIEQRNRQTEIANKKIFIDYEICGDETNFMIRDQGEGFDWREMLKKDIEPGLHGMGIKMTEGMVKRLTYNEVGNEVYFSVENAPATSFLVMRDFEIKEYKPGEVIKQTESGDNVLYWLIFGNAEQTFADGAKSLISPANIFAPDTVLENDAGARKFSLTAASDVKVMTVQKADMQSFIKRNPSFENFAKQHGLI